MLPIQNGSPLVKPLCPQIVGIFRLCCTPWTKFSITGAFSSAIEQFAQYLGRHGVTADVLTYGALILALSAGLAVALHHPGLGALLVLLSGCLDLLDGAVARATDSVSRWGALLDSTLDRIADAAPLRGISWVIAGLVASPILALADFPWQIRLPAIAIVTCLVMISMIAADVFFRRGTASASRALSGAGRGARSLSSRTRQRHEQARTRRATASPESTMSKGAPAMSELILTGRRSDTAQPTANQPKRRHTRTHTTERRQLLRTYTNLAYHDAISASAELMGIGNGYQIPRVSEIAEAVSVSSGTVYNHFEDKNALLSGIYGQQRIHLRGLLERPYESTCAPEQLRELIERVLRLFESEKQHIALIVRIAAMLYSVDRNAPTNSEGFNLLSRGEAIATHVADHLGLNIMLTGVSRQGIENHGLRDDLTMKALVQLLQTVVVSAATYQYEQPETLPLEQRRDLLAALVLEGSRSPMALVTRGGNV